MNETSNQNAINSMTEEDFRKEITPMIRRIMDAEFPESYEKRKVYQYPDRINFSCPFCGDSVTARKKRGNIITRGKLKGLYKCFNCGKSMSVNSFINNKAFKRLDLKLSSGASEYYDPKVFDSSSSVEYCTEFTSELFDIETIDKLSIGREEFKNALGLSECDNPADYNEGRAYLIKRCQYNFKKFLFNKNTDELFLLNLTPSGKIFGAQVRGIRNTRGGSKYISLNISKLREYAKLSKMEESENFDQMSLLFNALLIDYTKPIIATEGPMDSFLLPNGIAMCGGGKHIPLNFKIYYMFDSDNAGVEFAIDKLKHGAPVFMWSKFIDDLKLPHRKKWDWNDVILYSREYGLRIPKIGVYFTDEKLDIMNL